MSHSNGGRRSSAAQVTIIMELLSAAISMWLQALGSSVDRPPRLDGTDGCETFLLLLCGAASCVVVGIPVALLWLSASLAEFITCNIDPMACAYQAALAVFATQCGYHTAFCVDDATSRA